MTQDCGVYGKYTLPHYKTLCVGLNGRSSGCNGDSGGPLVCESGKISSINVNLKLLLNSGPHTEQFVLAGVASWASTKCQARTPTGYASVSHARSWIRRIANV